MGLSRLDIMVYRMPVLEALLSNHIGQCSLNIVLSSSLRLLYGSFSQSRDTAFCLIVLVNIYMQPHMRSCHNVLPMVLARP